MSNKDIIQKNFSRCARHYDRYSVVQDRAARMLVEQLNGSRFAKILDIGCGTGNYTGLLRVKFPDSRITALDVSREMLEVAAQKLNGDTIDFIAADGEKTQMREAFDLITSNACFQWFEDMRTAMTNCAASLRENGVLLFSAFGPTTYQELAACLKDSNEHSGVISSSAFLDSERIAQAMRWHFEGVSVQTHVFTETYKTLLELLNTIKYTGTRGLGTNGTGLGREKLARLEQIYRHRFGHITATYQIFFCFGQKRGSK